MSNKMSCDFSGFSDLVEQLDSISNDLKPAVTECLEMAHDLVTVEAKSAMKKHNRTNKVVNSLINEPTVDWIGNTASIEVGFKIQEGGLPSVFLMYGTPRISADKALYNAFYGSKMTNNITKKQIEIMTKYISLGK